MSTQLPFQPLLQSLWRWVSFIQWTLAVWLVAGLVALPVLVVLGSVFADASEQCSHLANTVLTEYVTYSDSNTDH